MKTLILIFLSIFICITSYSNTNSDLKLNNIIISEIGSVYEGKITAIHKFSSLSTNGLGEGPIYVKLDSYPDLNFEITAQKGVKWGLFKEIAPGLIMVSSDLCKGWTVRLTVNNKMVITKCKILSYADDTE